MKVPTQSQALSAIPLDPFDDSINAIFAGQLTGAPSETNADHIIKWDPLIQAYEVAFKVDGTGGALDGLWVESLSLMTSPLTFNPGEAFWIDNRQAATQTVYLMGAVVLTETNPVAIGPGLNTFSYILSARGSG